MYFEFNFSNWKKKLLKVRHFFILKMLLMINLFLKFSIEAQSSPKSSAKGKKGGKDSKATNAKSPKAKSPDKSVSPKGSKATTPKSKGKKGSKPATPVPAQTEAPQVPKGDEPPQPPQPGADDYTYVNEKLDMRMAKILSDHWDVIENTYINSSKFVFRRIRNEREQIIRYFFSIKSNFKEYLRRPDTKQIEVEVFVKVSQK
jgi:hypothetical protein